MHTGAARTERMLLREVVAAVIQRGEAEHPQREAIPAPPIRSAQQLLTSAPPQQTLRPFPSA
jgi:hypothetical protein